ncbi:hypothetical protein T484DRAFT_3091245 [Baffinella frigidus]|nr:hypothetical protein T484DRAFT_3091245 [Cryptophyta sp. CCMP2293]
MTQAVSPARRPLRGDDAWAALIQRSVRACLARRALRAQHPRTREAAAHTLQRAARGRQARCSCHRLRRAALYSTTSLERGGERGGERRAGGWARVAGAEGAGGVGGDAAHAGGASGGVCGCVGAGRDGRDNARMRLPMPPRAARRHGPRRGRYPKPTCPKPSYPNPGSWLMALDHGDRAIRSPNPARRATPPSATLNPAPHAPNPTP